MTPIVRGQLPLNWYEGLYPKEYLLPDGRVISYAGSRTDFFDPASDDHCRTEIERDALLVPLERAHAPRRHETRPYRRDGRRGTTSDLATRARPSAAAHEHEPRDPSRRPAPRRRRQRQREGRLPQYAAPVHTPPTRTRWRRRPRRALTAPAAERPGALPATTTRRRSGDDRALLAAVPVQGSPAHDHDRIDDGEPRRTVNITSTDVQGRARRAGCRDARTDMHQRLIELPLTTVSPGVFTAVGPSSNVAPPGPYMLFALNAAGVPSVAAGSTSSTTRRPRCSRSRATRSRARSRRVGAAPTRAAPTSTPHTSSRASR